MTEDKRFTLAYEKGKWWAVRDGEITLWKEEVIGLLNEQHETIQNKQNHIVVLENKIVRMRKAIHKLEWLSSHRNADLIRENGQLNRENKHIKTTVKQLYESERTELGKSVLKQVMEAIQ